MFVATYRTTSLGWETRKLLSRFNQWVSYQGEQTDIDAPDLPQWSWPEEIARVLSWVVLAGLTLWLCWLLYKALEPLVRAWWEREQHWLSLGANKAPAAETYSVGHWMRLAQQAVKQGNYKEACRALYRATLQQLHDTQTLLHDPSRTDGEYLETLRKKLSPGGSLPRPYQLLIGTHERLVFGSAIASAEMFKRCRRAYEEVAKTGEQKPEAAER